MIGGQARERAATQPADSRGGGAMGFNVSVRQVDEVTLVTITGSVMWAEAEALHEMFRDLLAKGQKRILLNLSSVKHLDSSGIGALAWAYVTVRKAGGELKMIHLSKQVQYLMELTALYKIFEDFENEESALDSFK
jgi:anti-sigma B factor antagonist